MIRLLNEVGMDFMNGSYAKSFELISDHDIHAYYRLAKDNDEVVHLQAYPGMSNEQEGRFFSRLMDYRGILAFRALTNRCPGNEHSAVTMPFINFGSGIKLPYSAKILEEMIQKNLRTD